MLWTAKMVFTIILSISCCNTSMLHPIFFRVFFKIEVHLRLHWVSVCALHYLRVRCCWRWNRGWACWWRSWWGAFWCCCYFRSWVFHSCWWPICRVLMNRDRFWGEIDCGGAHTGEGRIWTDQEEVDYRCTLVLLVLLCCLCLDFSLNIFLFLGCRHRVWLCSKGFLASFEYIWVNDQLLFELFNFTGEVEGRGKEKVVFLCYFFHAIDGIGYEVLFA